MEMIRRHELQPGGRLPSEMALSQQLGVSRPSLRQALMRLRAEGVIVSRRGSGNYLRPGSIQSVGASPGLVRIDSFEQIQKCYEFRKFIEGEACFLAASRRTPEQLLDIREALRALDRVVQAHVAEKGDLDFCFHLAIARASGNEWFASALQGMRSQIELAIDIARRLSIGQSEEHDQTVLREHVAIYEAIASEEPDLARRALHDHLSRTCQRMFSGPGSTRHIADAGAIP